MKIDRTDRQRDFVLKIRLLPTAETSSCTVVDSRQIGVWQRRRYTPSGKICFRSDSRRSGAPRVGSGPRGVGININSRSLDSVPSTDLQLMPAPTWFRLITRCIFGSASEQDASSDQQANNQRRRAIYLQSMIWCGVK